jgi:hypothetical protein
MLGHTWEYRIFIKRYANIIVPMENLLKNSEVFQWNLECDKAFNILKENLNTKPILIFPNWENKFHVHVDASGISLGAILVQPGEGEQLYNHIKGGFSYDLCFAKVRNYFLGSHFKFFTYHFALTYIVNKPILEGRICLWLLLF